jgi:hypothetical protein
MSKDFITVAAHRRAFPKRKFADGGASDDRPDLVILAKQGLSPEKAPGLPPRMKGEQMFGPESEVNTGNATPATIIRADDDAPRWEERKPSVLGEMMNTAADRVQAAHDDARAAAAIKAFHDRAPGKRFAIGGAYRTPDQQRADRERAYGFDPVSSYSMGADPAEEAAPAVLPSSVPLVSSRGSAARDADSSTAPTPAATSTAQAPYAGPVTIDTGAARGAGAANSPAPPRPFDWRAIAQGAVKAQQNAGSAAAASPVGALAALAGGALGVYLKRRKDAKNAATDKSISDSAARRTAGDSGASRSGSDIGTDASAADAANADDLEGVDLSGLVPEWGPDMAGSGFAQGGEVGPSTVQQRRARPMRPSAPGPGIGTLGAAPAGGSMQGLPPGVGGPTANQGMMPNPAQLQALRSAQMGQIGAAGGPPPGPPPGGPGSQFGGPPPGGPPPGGASMGPMAGPPPGGPGPQFGPPPGGPPPGGPPPGMNPFMAAQMGGAPPPPGPGGAPSAQALQQQMLAPGGMFGGPPPGGPPPGGPPPGGAQFGAMAPGGPNPQAAQQMAQQQALQAALAQQAQLGRPPGMATGGAVDVEGDSPRVKGKRDRQWGDAGKPAEDLPPEKKAKGGKVKHKAPFGKGAPPKKKVPPVPMVTDEDMDAPPPPTLAAAGPAGPPAGPPPGPPPAAPPPGMNKGGKCDDKMAKGGGVEQKGKTKGKVVKMADGGVAKVRRGFPNTLKKPAKRMAKGGSVRGCGVASKGKKFSGIY